MLRFKGKGRGRQLLLLVMSFMALVSAIWLAYDWVVSTHANKPESQVKKIMEMKVKP